MKFLPCLKLLIVLMCVVFPSDAHAQREIVVVRNRADSRGVSEFQGEILKYDREGLELETSDRGVKSIPAESVAEIRFQKSADFQLAEQCFAQGNYAEALRIFRMERQLTEKPWLRTLLTVRMIRCQTALGQTSDAMDNFAEMSGGEPNLTDEMLACIPLAWRSNPGQAMPTLTAVSLLRTSNDPPTVLMCASHLLSDARRDDALRRLKRLAETCKDTRIAQLAQFQLHRTEIPTVTSEVAARWSSEIETLPPELASGPNFVLGQAYVRLQLWDDAALAFLKSATVFPPDPIFAQEALQSAARALESGGHPEESVRLGRPSA